jgi:uncharacterized cupredoxin-like copper-binding protein
MAGIKLTIGQATQAKKLRSGNGFPDIMIFENYLNKDTLVIYSVLFLEVKKETPYKKNGMLKKDKHLLEQFKMHQKLIQRGYKVEFVWTFDKAKEIIDKYLTRIN